MFVVVVVVVVGVLDEEIPGAVVVGWLAPPAEYAPLLVVVAVGGDVAALLLELEGPGKQFFDFPHQLIPHEL